VAADDLETQVEDLYWRIQLPESEAERLREETAAEIEGVSGCRPGASSPPTG